MGMFRALHILASLLLVQSAAAELFSERWWEPKENVPDANFLCTCLAIEIPPNPNQNFLRNRHCPIDGTLERHRYMCAYFREFGVMRYLKKLANGQSVRVLHNAPEEAIARGLHFLKNPTIDYVGFDYMVGPLIYKSTLNEFKFDLSSMPFPDNYFHMVISSHVLEHVPNMTQCLHELYRVLKPGGVGFLSFPAKFDLAVSIEDVGEQLSPIERKQKFGQEDHYRSIGRDIVEKLATAGLKRDEDVSREPSNFYHRAHLAAAVKKYVNREFQASPNEQVWFIYKPGMDVPVHMKKE